MLMNIPEEYSVVFVIPSYINPFVTNGYSHPYHLDEPTFIFRGIRSNFSLLFQFLMEFNSANRIVWGYSLCLCPIKKDGGPAYMSWFRGQS